MKHDEIIFYKYKNWEQEKQTKSTIYLENRGQ